MGAATGMTGEWPWPVRVFPLYASIIVGGRGRFLGLLPHGPPHEDDQRDQRDLDRKHQPQKTPRHSRDPTLWNSEINAKKAREASIP
jgi:hypothetical protein